MFLSVGYFQMFKCDRKASSNNVPLEEKFQKTFCLSYGTYTTQTSNPVLGRAFHVSLLGLAGLTHVCHGG